MFNLKKKNFKNLDLILLLSLFFLIGYGLYVLNSATNGMGASYLKSQIIATALGFFLMIMLLFIDIDFVKKLQWPFWIISVLLLGLTLVFGHGDSMGARAWLKIGPVNFQPAEFVKLMLVVSLSSFIEKRKEKISRPLTLLAILIYAAIPIGLIFLQPDLGTSMVLLFMLVAMLFVNGLNLAYFFGALISAVIAFPIFYNHLDGYQKERILNFLDSSRNAESNYQIAHGRIAIGSGGIYGKGYLQGAINQNGFVPERHTDYIFAVLVEELGLIGACFLILAYGLLLWRMVKIAKNAKDSFSSSVATGYTAMLFIHIFENIGMTIGLMPVTGIPLPLMSYGGTFQIVVMLAIGAVISIGLERKQLDFSYKIGEK